MTQLTIIKRSRHLIAALALAVIAALGAGTASAGTLVNRGGIGC